MNIDFRPLAKTHVSQFKDLLLTLGWVGLMVLVGFIYVSVGVFVGFPLGIMYLIMTVMLCVGPFVIHKFARRSIELRLTEFAQLNNLTYLRSQSLPDIRLPLAPAKTKAFGQLDDVIVGSLDSHRFMFGITRVGAHPEQYGVLHYWGVMVIDLKRSYGHLVLDRLQREWSKADARQLEVIGKYQLYSIGDGSGAVPTVAQLAGLIVRLEEVPFDIEIRENKLYLIKEDGFNLTPQGVQKLFDLIKAVNILD